jgi:hypothetical protein
VSINLKAVLGEVLQNYINVLNFLSLSCALIKLVVALENALEIALLLALRGEANVQKSQPYYCN